MSMKVHFGKTHYTKTATQKLKSKTLNSFSGQKRDRNQDFSWISIISNQLTISVKKTKNLKVYKCDECEEFFRSATQLQIHKEYMEHNCSNIISHNKVLPNQVPETKVGGEGEKLKIVSKRSQSLEDNVGKLNDSPKDSRYSLWCKKIRENGNKYFHCYECKYFSRQANHVTRHMNNVHKVPNPKLFKCDFCGEGFDLFTLLRTHVRTNCGTEEDKSKEGMTKFKCSKCDYQSYNSSHIRRHMEKLHRTANSDILKCEFCQKKFLSDQILNSHVVVCSKICKISSMNPDLCQDNSVGPAKKKMKVSSHLVKSEHKEVHRKGSKCSLCSEIFHSGTELRAHEIKCQRMSGVGTGTPRSSNHGRSRLTKLTNSSLTSAASQNRTLKKLKIEKAISSPTKNSSSSLPTNTPKTSFTKPNFLNSDKAKTQATISQNPCHSSTKPPVDSSEIKITSLENPYLPKVEEKAPKLSKEAVLPVIINKCISPVLEQPSAPVLKQEVLKNDPLPKESVPVTIKTLSVANSLTPPPSLSPMEMELIPEDTSLSLANGCSFQSEKSDSHNLQLELNPSVETAKESSVQISKDNSVIEEQISPLIPMSIDSPMSVSSDLAFDISEIKEFASPEDFAQELPSPLPSPKQDDFIDFPSLSMDSPTSVGNLLSSSQSTTASSSQNGDLRVLKLNLVTVGEEYSNKSEDSDIQQTDHTSNLTDSHDTNDSEVNISKPQRKIYDCPECKYTSHLPWHVGAHMKRVHRIENPKIHKCDFCGEYLENVRKYKYHVGDGYCINTNKDFAQQRKDSQKPMRFSCSQCSYQSAYGHHFKSHMARVHNIERQKLVCKFCGEVFQDMRLLNKHSGDTCCVNTSEDFAKQIKESERPKRYHCSECQYAATYSHHIRGHARSRHQIEILKFEKCLCGENFMNTEQLAKHEAACKKKDLIEPKVTLKATKSKSKSKKSSGSPDKSYVCGEDEKQNETDSKTIVPVNSQLKETDKQDKIVETPLQSHLQNLKDEASNQTAASSNYNGYNNEDRKQMISEPNIKLEISENFTNCFLCSKTFQTKLELDKHLIQGHENPNKQSPKSKEGCNSVVMEQQNIPEVNGETTVGADMVNTENLVQEYLRTYGIDANHSFESPNNSVFSTVGNQFISNAQSQFASSSSQLYTIEDDKVFHEMTAIPPVEIVSYPPNDMTSYPSDMVFSTEPSFTNNGWQDPLVYTFDYVKDENILENMVFGSNQTDQLVQSEILNPPTSQHWNGNGTI